MSASRGTIRKPADVIVFVIALVGITFGIGEWIGRTAKVAYECEPGYVKSAHHPDGSLSCWYRVTDWRGVTVQKPARRVRG